VRSHTGDPRVVVTGLGAVTSIGIGADAFAAGLRAGRSGARPVATFDPAGFDHGVACEIVDFDPSPWIRTLDPAALGRAALFAVAASRMAVDHAGLGAAAAGELSTRAGLVAIGTTDGESRDLDDLAAQELARGWAGIDPALARRAGAGQLSVAVARELGLAEAEAVTVATACAAGNVAIGYGFDAIVAGDTDLAICGGADAFSRKTFTGFYRLGAVAPLACQPFDRNRKGILPGEGAGAVVLESLDAARRRAAPIYAEVLGYGVNCDASHQTAPDRDSVADCIRLALDNAGVKPHEVDLISAHGTATKANDVAEVHAIRQVYGDRPPRTVSMKSMLGHALGAASALAAVGCVLAIRDAFIPPTINHVETDPECPIDCVPNEAVPAELRIVQNNGLAFGGNNAVLILGRYEEGQ
jgi:3-oxoacyl-[acyl-carrier-protein] synthase II